MNAAIVLLASQVLALATPVTNAPEAPRSARVTALATAEILPSASTRDEGGVRALTRHRRAAEDGRIIIDFE